MHKQGKRSPALRLLPSKMRTNAQLLLADGRQEGVKGNIWPRRDELMFSGFIQYLPNYSDWILSVHRVFEMFGCTTVELRDLGQDKGPHHAGHRTRDAQSLPQRPTLLN